MNFDNRKSGLSLGLIVVAALWSYFTFAPVQDATHKVMEWLGTDTESSQPAQTPSPDGPPQGPSEGSGDVGEATYVLEPGDTIDIDGSRPGLPVIADDSHKAEARAIIETVRVAGRGPKTGYARDEFGRAWVDDNDAGMFSRNGCDTRNDILRRDLIEITVRPRTKDCVIETGYLLMDPYLGTEILFTKTEAIKVQIDHVIPLSLAWQMGAARWDYDKRVAFANDPLNLLASDGPTNGSKGDKSIASWLPPYKPVRCSYALRMAQVSVKYDLPATSADKDMMLTQCGG